mmetsp:Transcript_11073/g.21198  ORF Transcript_11073/g.21198 Transcript_11073/m.21198 type:complete len:370 (+) Transcript_11073:139-1248(+)
MPARDRINGQCSSGQLVDILESKCAKIRQQADEQGQLRVAAERKYEAVELKLRASAEEAEHLQQLLSSCEQQVEKLHTADSDRRKERQLAASAAAELRSMQAECNQARLALHRKNEELRNVHAQTQASEVAWKDQVVKLIAETTSAESRAAGFEEQIERESSDARHLIVSTQDLVCRYERESVLRLELEERCILLEEKLRARDGTQRQRAQQNLEAKNKAEELAQQHDARSLHAQGRVEQAEKRCQELEAELQKAKLLCLERDRRLHLLEKQAGEHSSAAKRRLPVGAVRRVVSLPASNGPAGRMQELTSSESPRRFITRNSSVSGLSSGGSLGPDDPPNEMDEDRSTDSGEVITLIKPAEQDASKKKK